MQLVLSVLRLALAVAAIWLIALSVIVFTREVWPNALTAVPMVETVEKFGPGPWLEENALKPLVQHIAPVFRNKSPEEALRELLIGVVTSILETLLKLTATDLVNLFLVGIIVPLFTLGFNRMRNLTGRRLCSTHLYLVTLKAVSNVGFIVGAAGPQLRHVPVNQVTRDRLRRLRAELDVLSDFAIAYQHVFTRRARRISVPARMCVAPVREVIDLMIDEMDKTKAATIDLDADRFRAVMLYRGRNLLVKGWHFIEDLYRRVRGLPKKNRAPDQAKLTPVHIWLAAGSALELNFQLAERLEGRFLLMFPPAGRTLPRRVRLGALREWRKLCRDWGFPALAKRLLKADRNPLWEVSSEGVLDDVGFPVAGGPAETSLA